MSRCHCLIWHPHTEKEKEQVREKLEYSRSIGDTVGIQVCLAQLQGCPKKEQAG